MHVPSTFTLCAAISLSTIASALARDTYVGADGSSQGQGTRTDPIDLRTALSDGTRVRPGDTVWLLAGTYQGPFRKPPKPAGTADKPIIYRAVPGERVRLTAGPDNPHVLDSYADHVWFWGLEVTSTGGATAQGGVAVRIGGGNGVKLINLIVHDNPNRSGVGAWDVGNDQEIYGCLLYRNGLHGKALAHGIYTQNTNRHTTKKVIDCLIFNNFGYGVHCYGRAPALANYVFEGVAAYGNGMPEGSDRPVVNFLVGGSKNPSDNIAVRSCFTFFPASGRFKRGADFGYNADNNGSLRVEQCVFVGGQDAVQIKRWQQLTFRDNLCVTTTGHALRVELPSQKPGRGAYRFDRNVYVTAADTAPVWFARRTFSDIRLWQSLGPWDRRSLMCQGYLPPIMKPSQPLVILRPNRYEPNRAHLIAYNWPGRATVQVDLRRLWRMKRGERYRIVNAENVWGAADAEGAFTGRPVLLRMSGPYAPAFACYVVTRSKP